MLKHVHEIEFIKKTNSAKSPLDHEHDMIRALKKNGLKPVIKGYVMPWKGVFTKVVIDFGDDVVEERTIDAFKRGGVKAKQKVELRQQMKQEITASIKAVSEDLEFICFMPKTKSSHHIHYKVRNSITGKEIICLARNHHKEKFTKILTPAHLKRDTSQDGKVAKAKDIPFVKYHNSSKTPEEVEQLVIERCKELNITYNGFVLPFTRYFDVSISITLESGESKIIKAKGFVEGTITGLGRRRAKINSGYMNDGLPTWFYLIKIGDSHLKYGVSKDIVRRFKEHQRNTDLPLTLIRSHYFEDGYFADLMEEEIARRFSTNTISKRVFKAGYSETLDIIDSNAVNEFIDDFINEPGEKDYFGWLSPKDEFNEDTFEMSVHQYGVYNPYCNAA
ncbi:Uncharacterised protein [Escherichia coli]|uniref:hypothetical protein n=1 Tax=Escherichia coli TaxID=562 RepID=UPI00191A840B|nr:hypothetical protein [Escherichia coli]UMT09733.1 hypothetical protein AOY62_14950 [Escherichia coli]CAD5752475.1 Uncharacterised protein [Escherichia coli]CAD6112844.1 Uncharacterised protein [Escherichia coli]CAD6530614.1 Uncharacterised protein [Escherichia coli]